MRRGTHELVEPADVDLPGEGKHGARPRRGPSGDARLLVSATVGALAGRAPRRGRRGHRANAHRAAGQTAQGDGGQAAGPGEAGPGTEPRGPGPRGVVAPS